MSLHSYLNRCDDRLRALRDQDLLRVPAVVDVLPEGRCCIDGRTLVNLGGNDYLNLAHEITPHGTCESAALMPAGATASAAVAGRSRSHAQLEQVLAEFEGTESALLFPTGFAANLGVLGSLVESDDAVFCDRDNHASIIDAARSCDGRLLVYRRDRLEAFEQSLAQRRSSYQRVYIVTDGVFSMDGEAAPLQQLCDIAERHDSAVIVDKAHGTGIIGATPFPTIDSP